YRHAAVVCRCHWVTVGSEADPGETFHASAGGLKASTGSAQRPGPDHRQRELTVDLGDGIDAEWSVLAVPGGDADAHLEDREGRELRGCDSEAPGSDAVVDQAAEAALVATPLLEE